VGAQSDLRYEQYRTEPDIGTFGAGLKKMEFEIMSDKGITFLSTSDIRKNECLDALVFVNCHINAR
jgi:hypothetical protein